MTASCCGKTGFCPGLISLRASLPAGPLGRLFFGYFLDLFLGLVLANGSGQKETFQSGTTVHNQAQ